MPIIPECRRLSHEDPYKFKTGLSYIVRSCLKEKKKRKNLKLYGQEIVTPWLSLAQYPAPTILPVVFRSLTAQSVRIGGVL